MSHAYRHVLFLQRKKVFFAGTMSGWTKSEKKKRNEGEKEGEKGKENEGEKEKMRK